ncbi:DUF5617 domain-containing protein [Thiotrichales bacterium 19S3-7]|nr:DUF5617 domain-containing protein [Thiotrichales bacterium 19S3-7]MCF6802420.1 DUF5617 domain-containing protein [Thiotrichales bacterium 19S3-11]
MISAELDPIIVANALLSDYVKGSKFGRITHLHWNRHHTSEVEKFLKDNEYPPDIDTYKNELFNLFEKIEAKPSFSKDGSFVRRMKLINKVFERAYHNDQIAPPKVPLLFKAEDATRLIDKHQQAIYTFR